MIKPFCGKTIKDSKEEKRIKY